MKWFREAIFDSGTGEQLAVISVPEPLTAWQREVIAVQIRDVRRRRELDEALAAGVPAPPERRAPNLGHEPAWTILDETHGWTPCHAQTAAVVLLDELGDR